MGERANHLLSEKSPYLLQHAYNPVDWYPWGEEAFAKAVREDKPIFLSIGYSTCHWCHVMAHESFENPEIAKLLNQWFVSIKVDREERPDIDQMYMAATQMMSGAGGWPMSVFLLPDGSPFYAGTYFPTRSSYQRPGFADLLAALNKAWAQNRVEVRQIAVQLVSRLGLESRPAAAAVRGDAAQRCYTLLAQSYDDEKGGFGDAPKFPRSVVFSFLFDRYRRTGEEAAKEMALHTLRQMASGGVYDHLGGGFHRYSVDADWFVPHFEKMLYDQGQLAHNYLDGFLLTGDHLYARVAQEIFDYVICDMQDPGGGFYSAEDADSINPYAPEEHGEGAYYLWMRGEVEDLLDPEAAELFCYVYGVEEHGNVRQDPLGEFTGRNILSLVHGLQETANRFSLKPEEVDFRLEAARHVLLQARSKRTRPHCDDKIITCWNALMIGAMARGERILKDDGLLGAAVRAVTFIRENLYDPATRTLMRRYRDKEAGCAGQLDDYVNLADALLALYQAAHDPSWLIWAEELTERTIQLFWQDEGGFFYDSVADSSLKVRMRGSYDGAEPAGNSVAAHNLLRLARLRARDDLREKAQRLFFSFSQVIEQYPPALPLMLSAWQCLDDEPMQVVVAGDRGAANTEALLQVAERRFDPHRLILLADGGENQQYLSERLPFLDSVRPIDNRATAYVCVDFTCKQPVYDPAELARLLAEADGRAG